MHASSRLQACIRTVDIKFRVEVTSGEGGVWIQERPTWT